MNRLAKNIFNLLKKIIIGFVLLSILSVLLLRWFDPFASALMVERKLFNWYVQQQRIWADWDNLSDNIKIAVIASEDQNFANHLGFDLAAISNVLEYNKNHAAIRGASTITQQVAKNLFLWSSRSWIRKGFESWFTIWIELLWSKQRILEIYLNSAEWGKGIFGIEAASRYYFNVSAKQLSIEQASLLAAILPNPRYWSPTKPSASVKNRARWIRQQIKNLGTEYYLQQLN